MQHKFVLKLSLALSVMLSCACAQAGDTAAATLADMVQTSAPTEAALVTNFANLVRFNTSYNNYIFVLKSGGGQSSWSGGASNCCVINNVSTTAPNRIQFDDAFVALDIDGNAGKVYRLYKAAYNRVAEPAGIGYWMRDMDNGSSLTTIAAGFMASAEFQNLYGSNPSNADFLDRVYSNVLHRAPDAAGRAYWLDRLNSGMPRSAVLASFSEDTENRTQVQSLLTRGIVYVPY